MAGDFTWSGYKAVSSNVLTTELNSLGDGNTTALSSEIDNTSNKYMLADFQLDLASVTISSTSAYCTLFVIPTVDGTNYPDWGSSTYGNYDAAYAVGTFLFRT